MDHSYGHSYDDEHPWHDVDGAGEWRGRKVKRKRKQRLAAVAPPPALDLTIRGNGCRITQDDGLAEKIENGFHLINFFEDRFVLSDDDESEGGDDCASTCKSELVDGDGDEDGGKGVRNGTDVQTGGRTLYMDRYDVRMLIDDYSMIRRNRNRRPSNNNNNQVDMDDGLSKPHIDEINFDRFGALPEYREIFLGDNQNNGDDSDGKSAGNLDDQDGHNNKNSTAKQGAEEEPLTLTEEEAKCLPKGIVLPLTKRQNDIIQLTAKRAADQPQFEVLLKVKQTDNPDFAFLRPESNLYPYYSWLKGRKGIIVGDRSESRSSSSSSEREDGIGGFLAGYGSSSDEEDEEEGKVRNEASEGTEKTGGSEGDATKNATSAESLEETNESSLEEKRAKRLKNAQELKAHFESKLAKDSI